MEKIPKGDDSFLSIKAFHFPPNSTENRSGLELAMYRERFDIVKILLETYKVNRNGTNLDKMSPLASNCSTDPLHFLVLKLSVVKNLMLLHDHGANPNFPISAN